MMVGPAVALPDNAPHLLVVDDDRRIRDLLYDQGFTISGAIWLLPFTVKRTVYIPGSAC